MWTWEHTLLTDAPAAVIWERYVDTTGWPAWDHGLASLTLDGPFAVGTTGTADFIGPGPLPYRLTAVEPGRRFADVTELPGMTVAFEHTLEPLAAGTRMTHRITITGPDADTAGPAVGSGIAGGVPESMANLVALAGGQVTG